MAKISPSTVHIVSRSFFVFSSIAYICAIFTFDYLDEKNSDGEIKNLRYGIKHFWPMFFCVIPVFFDFCLRVTFFLFMAYADSSRRKFTSTIVTQMLEHNIFKLDDKSTFFASPINFMDPNSLVAWLNMRKVTLNIGYKFRLRINFSIMNFLLVALLLLILTLLILANVINPSTFSKEEYTIISLFGINLLFFLLRVLYSLADLNQLSINQVKALLELRMTVFRMINDNDLLTLPLVDALRRCNNRLQRCIMRQIHYLTIKLNKDEQMEKKKEILKDTIENLN